MAEESGKHIQLIIPYSPEEFRSYYQARWEILRKPLGQPKGSEVDNAENISIHVMVVAGKDIVGVGRLTYLPKKEGQIRYMGVRDELKHGGIGSKILKFLEKEAKKLEIHYIFLNARESALEFYKKNGYEEEDKPFKGTGDIMHTKMSKTLPA